MKIGVISTLPETVSTKRLMESIINKGHEALLLDPNKLYTISSYNKDSVYFENKDLCDLDAIIPRVKTEDIFFISSLIGQFELMDVFSTLSSNSLSVSRNKLRTLQILSKHNINIPKTILANNIDLVDDIIDAVGCPLIIKTIEGSQGIGVILAETKSSAKSIIEYFYSIKKEIIVQEFIEESRGTDIRVFVIDNEIVGSMLRKSTDGDFRSNLHRGGESSKVLLTDEEREIAIKASAALGLKISGVDIIRSNRGPLVLEVNSSPGLEGIEKTTNVDIGKKIVEFIEKSLKNI